MVGYFHKPHRVIEWGLNIGRQGFSIRSDKKKQIKIEINLAKKSGSIFLYKAKVPFLTWVFYSTGLDPKSIALILSHNCPSISAGEKKQ